MLNLNAPTLYVTNLSISLKKKKNLLPLVKRISFEVHAGETMALVGESGSGKTLTSLALLGLLPKNLQQTEGKILFEGKPLSKCGDLRFSEVRGAEISMIFQEPRAALNPVFTVGSQIEAVIKTHLKLNRRLAKKKILMLFEEVGLTDPEKIYKAYPHQLSGGMAQRAMIAMALCCNPKLIIADEPTTALDVLTQYKILNLILKLQEEYNFGLLLISHDNKVVERMADSIIKMHAGEIVSTAPLLKVVSIPL